MIADRAAGPSGLSLLLNPRHSTEASRFVRAGKVRHVREPRAGLVPRAAPASGSRHPSARLPSSERYGSVPRSVDSQFQVVKLGKLIGHLIDTHPSWRRPRYRRVGRLARAGGLSGLRVPVHPPAYSHCVKVALC